MAQIKTNDKKNYLGMLVITWILIFLTLPFIMRLWLEKQNLDSQLTECEKVCYTYLGMDDGENYCTCKPQIKSRLP